MNSLRISGKLYACLKEHLFPGDACEAVALVLCGRHGDCLLARHVFPIPYDQCSVRTPDRVTWPTDLVPPILERASAEGLAVVKVHSHPAGLRTFSLIDDAADRDLFRSVHGWLAGPHASALMLADGKLLGRTVSAEGAFTPMDVVALAGDDLQCWWADTRVEETPAFAERIAQTFGAGTTALVRRLTIGVVGCSGTGSLVVEQLARNGVGTLVLVDPDAVEQKNLNRLVNATAADVGTAKVTVLARAIEKMGLGTEVITHASTLFTPAAVRALASCNVLFGCMDTVDGRHVLNRLATFYLVPYFDLGVRLEADGRGGITEVCGTVHYLQPGGSSLLSRGVYTPEQARAAALHREDPATYHEHRRVGYIADVSEDRPAVISVNMQVASLAVTEFLARLHPFRQDSNSAYAIHRFSLSHGLFLKEPDGEPCTLLARHVGRGDVQPLLEMPSLDDQQAAA